MSATIFTIKRSEIEGRLDPEFYNPKYFKIFKNEKSNWIRLNSIVKTLKHPPEYKRIFVENGYQLIRSQNVRPLGINLDENPVYLANEIVNNSSSIFPKKNDILIVRSGVNAGDVAVVEEDFPNTTVGADTLLLNVTDEVLPKFVQIYFFSDVGRNQLNRYLTGATNKHINSFSIKRVYFPKLDLQKQKQCINLFETSLFQKEQKQQQAKHLLDSIDSYLLDELGIKLPEKDNSLSKRNFTTKFSEVSGGRWDPFWQISQQNKMKSNNFSEFKVKELANIQKGESITSDEIKEGNFPVIAGGKTSPYSHNVSNFNGNVITISASGAYSGYVWYHKKPIFASDCSVLTSLDESNCTTLFLYEVLHLKQEELYNLQQGAGQPHVYPDDIAEIKIPLPPLPKQKEIASHIREIREQAKQLQVEAEQTMQEAKKQIEKMILGG